MKILVLIGLLSLASCGRMNRIIQGWTGNAVPVCVDGVSYLQFESGVTVQYTKVGTVMTCSN